MTQHEPVAPATNMNRPRERYAVTVEVTVHAWSADEAAQVVRGFLSDVLAGSEHQMGNVRAANTEPPCDELWRRALDCAGALA